MKRIVACLAVASLALGCLLSTKGEPPATPHWILSNEHWTVTVQQRGAILSSLRWNARSPNWLAPQTLPLTASGYGRYGHFLCFDRWGPVTQQEAARGIPFHGAAGLLPWNPLRISHRALALRVALPVTRLEARRTLRMAADSNVLLIANRFHNPTSTPHSYNVVEHAMLSPHWFNGDIRLFTNADMGFIQGSRHVVPNSRFAWPHARINNRIWDLSEPAPPEGSTIASLVFPSQAQWGWVCLQNEKTGELLGYIWFLADYPWLNLWWSCHMGHVLNRAIEPGTTGLCRPLPDLKKTGSKLDRPVYVTLPPKSFSRTYSLWCFALHHTREGGTIRQVAINPQCTAILVTGATKAWSLALP